MINRLGIARPTPSKNFDSFISRIAALHDLPVFLAPILAVQSKRDTFSIGNLGTSVPAKQYSLQNGRLEEPKTRRLSKTSNEISWQDSCSLRLAATSKVVSGRHFLFSPGLELPSRKGGQNYTAVKSKRPVTSIAVLHPDIGMDVGVDDRYQAPFPNSHETRNTAAKSESVVMERGTDFRFSKSKDRLRREGTDHDASTSTSQNSSQSHPHKSMLNVGRSFKTSDSRLKRRKSLEPTPVMSDYRRSNDDFYEGDSEGRESRTILRRLMEKSDEYFLMPKSEVTDEQLSAIESAIKRSLRATRIDLYSRLAEVSVLHNRIPWTYHLLQRVIENEIDMDRERMQIASLLQPPISGMFRLKDPDNWNWVIRYTSLALSNNVATSFILFKRIRAFLALQDPHQAQASFDLLEVYGIPVTGPFFDKMIQVYLTAKDVESAMKVIEAKMAAGWAITSDTAERILRGLKGVGSAIVLEKFLLEQIDRNYNADVRFLNTLMSSRLMRGDITNALQLLDRFDFSTFSNTTDRTLAHDSARLAPTGVARRKPSPDIATFSMLINTCGRLKDYSSAYIFFDQFIRMGLTPSDRFIMVTARLLVQQYDLATAEKWLADLATGDATLPGLDRKYGPFQSGPQVYDYIYCEHQRSTGFIPALNYFDRVEDEAKWDPNMLKRVQRDFLTHLVKRHSRQPIMVSQSIMGLVEAGKVKATTDLMNATLHTWWQFILKESTQSLKNIDRPRYRIHDEAEVLPQSAAAIRAPDGRRLGSSHGVEQKSLRTDRGNDGYDDSVQLQTDPALSKPHPLAGLTKLRGHLKHVYSFIKTMTDHGAVANSDTQIELMNFHSYLDKIDDVWAFLREERSQRRLIPNVKHILTIIHSCICKRQLHSAFDTVKEGQSLGVPPHINMYEALLHGAVTLHSMEGVTRAIEEMEAASVPPTKRWYITLASHYAKSGYPDKVLQLFGEANERVPGLIDSLDPVMVSVMYTALSQCGKALEAQQLIKRKLDAGMTVDMAIYRSVQSSLRWTRYRRNAGDKIDAHFAALIDSNYKELSQRINSSIEQPSKTEYKGLLQRFESLEVNQNRR